MPASRSLHPSRDQLHAFGQGRLPPDQMAGVESHVAACDSCCQQLQQVPEDTLVHLAREAATFGFRHENSRAAPDKAAPHDIPPELRDHPRYRVLGLIGVGGMGAVYKAEHRLMQRLVALKVINPSFLKNEAAVERFHREFRAAARLSHPNVVTAYDADQAGKLHFMAMELAEGLSLDRLVQQLGRLPVARACYLIRQAALGLQHLHEKKMVHRDIKPQNVMVGRKDHVKILDCGLARLASEGDAAPAAGDTAGPHNPRATTAGMILGTPDYIAPEQAADARSADIRADIYSLGCTLYFALTGQPPFPKGSFVEKLTLHSTAQPAPLSTLRTDVPRELVRVINRMMAKQPSERYQVPGDVAKDLAPLARDEKASGKRVLPGANDLPESAGPHPAPGSQPQAAEPLVQVAADDDAPATLLDPLANLDLGSLSNLPPVVKAGSGAGFSLNPTHLVAVLLACGTALAIIILAGAVANSLWPPSRGAQSPNKQTAQSTGSVRTGIPSPAIPPKATSGMPKVDEPPYRSSRPSSALSSAVQYRALLVIPSVNLWGADYVSVRKALDKLNLKCEVASVSLDPSSLKDTPQQPGPSPNVLYNKYVRAQKYDFIIFTGFDTHEFTSGPAANDTRRLLAEFKQQGKLVTAICRGQQVLAEHGELAGKKVAKCQYVEAYEAGQHFGANVEVDGQIVTASGAMDALEFVQQIVATLNAQTR